MREIPNESVQLVLTSPPYPMIEMWDAAFSSWSTDAETALSRNDGDGAFICMHACLDTVWNECARILEPGGFACVNIGDATRTINGSFRLFSNHARIISAFERVGFHTLPCIIWRKQTNSPTKFMGSGMLPSGAYVTLEHEYILVFRKGEKRNFAGQDRIRRRESAFFWEERNKWFSDMWDFKGARQLMDHTGKRDRSAAYPLELAHRIICMYSAAGDTVVDPFLGTGTTLTGCLLNGRRCIGYEIDEGLRPLIEAQVMNCREELNAMTRARFSDHLDFIAEYRMKKGEPKYRNDALNCTVITSQETDLRLNNISDIRTGADGTVTCSYKVFP